MKRISVFAFLIYYALGSVLFPMGDLSYVKDVPEMYRHCAIEDPDINIIDFVFEHLANIGGDTDPAEHEKPHQPIYQHSPAQLVAMFSPGFKLQLAPIIAFFGEKQYPVMLEQKALNEETGEVFRPPIS